MMDDYQAENTLQTKNNKALGKIKLLKILKTH